MLTKEKSEKLARHIEMVKLQCHLIDWDYANEVAYGLITQAARQDSLACLKPAHSQLEQNELLREQARALRHLLNFIDTLKKCDEMKDRVKQMQTTEEKVQSLFL